MIRCAGKDGNHAKNLTVRQVQSPVAKQMNRMRCNEKNVFRHIVKRQRYFDKYGCGMRAVSDKYLKFCKALELLLNSAPGTEANVASEFQQFIDTLVSSLPTLVQVTREQACEKGKGKQSFGAPPKDLKNELQPMQHATLRHLQEENKMLFLQVEAWRDAYMTLRGFHEPPPRLDIDESKLISLQDLEDCVQHVLDDDAADILALSYPADCVPRVA